jgi:protein KRI1
VSSPNSDIPSTLLTPTVEEKYKNSRSAQAGAASDATDSDSSSEDETEDEDGFLATEDLDAQISGVLSAIKNKDPRVRDKDFSFFQAQAADTPAGQKKEKPLFLKDYHREKILAGDVGASDDEDDRPPRTYAQEQEALKRSIVSEINKAADAEDDEDAGSDGDFVRKKAKKVKAAGADGVHPERAGTVNALTDTDIANASRDPETFLSNFMASRAWLEDGNGRNWEAFESDDDDGDGVERAEAFEQAYNMRFEDPNKSNEVLRTYAREITNEKSVRRDEMTGRRRQRQLEKEQREAEKQQRRDEKQRLRRLKVEEAEEKLGKIRKVAGLSGKALTGDEWLRFLNEDWQGDDWEREMQKRFGDAYYAAADAAGSEEDEGEDGETDKKKKKKKPKKPTWDDDIDINDIIPDFKADEKPDVTLSDEEEAQEEDIDEEEDDEDAPPSKKRKTAKDHKKLRQAAKQAHKADRAKIEALIDARMGPADDDTVLAPRTAHARRQREAEEEAGVRFRYRETSPQSFGMTPRDILLAPSDADLNRFAGLKKLATFRDAEKKRKDKKHLGKKARLREWRRETFGRRFERTGPVWEGFEDKPAAAAAAAAAPKEEEKVETPAAAEDAQKKKRKRSRGKKSGGAAVEEAADEAMAEAE